MGDGEKLVSDDKHRPGDGERWVGNDLQMDEKKYGLWQRGHLELRASSGDRWRLGDARKLVGLHREVMVRDDWTANENVI